MLPDRRGRLFPAYVLIKVPRLGDFFMSVEKMVGIVVCGDKGDEGPRIGGMECWV